MSGSSQSITANTPASAVNTPGAVQREPSDSSTAVHFYTREPGDRISPIARIGPGAGEDLRTGQMQRVIPEGAVVTTVTNAREAAPGRTQIPPAAPPVSQAAVATALPTGAGTAGTPGATGATGAGHHGTGGPGGPGTGGTGGPGPGGGPPHGPGPGGPTPGSPVVVPSAFSYFVSRAANASLQALGMALRGVGTLLNSRAFDFLPIMDLPRAWESIAERGDLTDPAKRAKLWLVPLGWYGAGVLFLSVVALSTQATFAAAVASVWATPLALCIGAAFFAVSLARRFRYEGKHRQEVLETAGRGLEKFVKNRREGFQAALAPTYAAIRRDVQLWHDIAHAFRNFGVATPAAASNLGAQIAEQMLARTAPPALLTQNITDGARATVARLGGLSRANIGTELLPAPVAGRPPPTLDHATRGEGNTLLLRLRDKKVVNTDRLRAMLTPAATEETLGMLMAATDVEAVTERAVNGLVSGIPAGPRREAALERLSKQREGFLEGFKGRLQAGVDAVASGAVSSAI